MLLMISDTKENGENHVSLNKKEVEGASRVNRWEMLIKRAKVRQQLMIS